MLRLATKQNSALKEKLANSVTVARVVTLLHCKRRFLQWAKSDQQDAWVAQHAFRSLGPDAVRATAGLAEILTTNTSPFRLEACSMLEWIPEQAEPAIPILVHHLGNTNQGVHNAARYTLTRIAIGSRGDPREPHFFTVLCEICERAMNSNTNFLISCPLLTELSGFAEDSFDRFKGPTSLDKLRTVRNSELAVLSRYISDPNPEVRQLATDRIKLLSNRPDHASHNPSPAGFRPADSKR